ncbi:SusD/RagB family nutrient-binding outer membrane lipoprotein [Psychroflexus sp. CAK8W]|uniref:SusD/RagB family nutrient-binding outer membrane lipoprotein n=1 Tax=Psychroflexus longus TaxID=2873596 RepID=A0ABS7XLB9_9FLAO|nr:SusD/RagB family nutrient-binding outer membrane lipoprotein [Psychroflexus longus]MBZ9779787.1 SusD/RagB family nutrient-binding outer membrane lipoprotein [Psychroflexus longus]
MQFKTSYLLLVFGLLLLVSCQDYDEFQNDPNRTTQANPGLLLTNIEVSTLNSIDLNASMASRHLVNVNLVEDSQYYGWDRASFGFYNTLRQVKKMEEEAVNFQNQNFTAIARFFEAFIYEQITRQFGDIPQSEAMLAESGNFQPVYDPQEQVYLRIFELLEEANSLLEVTGPAINGDVVFNNDLLKWKKFINSFHLRVLMSLSVREDDPNLNLPSRFNTIYSNAGVYPIMESTDDNAFYSYSEETGNVYPFWRNASITTSYILEETFVERLKTFSDPRLFEMASPDSNSSDDDPLSFDSYSGLLGSAPLNANVARLTSGEGSSLNSRYVEDAEAEVNLSLGFAELNFILAEAAHRNWIPADADGFYEAGIRASMDYYDIDANLVDNYLAQPIITYQTSTGLEQILTQKHTAMFLNSGWEPFYDNRRTGFPEFNVDGGGIINEEGVPKRWMYPFSEINQNVDNLQQAIQRQFPLGDNVNAVMWSIQN